MTATADPSYIHYGRDFADIYDTLFPRSAIGQHELDWLARNTADARRVLELGVGTGRVAIPLANFLARRGAAPFYRGIDVSEQMLDRLRAVDRAGRVESEAGDIVGIPFGDGYDSILCVCATISMIVDVGSQRKVFHKAAEALNPGGTFVVETHNSEFVRGLHSAGPITYAVPYPEGQQALVSFSNLSGSSWHIDHCWIDNGSAMFVSEDSRVTSLQELDGYADSAGLVLVQHSAGLTGGPIEQTSGTVTAVYRKPSQ